MEDFHFLRPLWFLAFIPLMLILWLLWNRTINSQAWRTVCDPELLPYLLVDEQGVAQRWPLLAIGLTGLLGITAIAGPVWEQHEQPVFREQSALVLALDLSRSMDATDIKPSRLARARHKIQDILKQRREGQTALIVYAATPFLITPLTDDQATIAAQVNSLDTGLMPSQGSRPDLAIAKAAELLQQAGHQQGDILLITDGIKPISVEQAIAGIGDKNYRISLLGIGTKEGAPIALADGGFLKNSAGEIVLPRLETQGLSKLAQASGGRFHKLSIDDSDIKYLLPPPQSQQINQTEQEVKLTTDQWQEEGAWLLLLILPLAALAFRRGYLVLAVFILLPHPQTASAVDWQNLWSRPDQQATQTLQQGDASAAAQQFKNSEWKAAAHYKAGEYEQAIESLDGINTPNALYNKGNALARAGKLPEALQTYDEALKLDPTSKDTKYNRELVEKQLEQQQKQEQQQQNSDEDQEQSEEEKQQDQSDQQQESQDKSENQDQSDEQQEQQDSQQGEPSDEEQEQQQSDARQDEQQSEEEKQQEEASAAEEAEKQDDSEQEESQMAKPDEMTEEEKNEAQATEQWLRRIPDDPGGLLRRKFKYQYQRQQQPVREAQQW